MRVFNVADCDLEVFYFEIHLYPSYVWNVSNKGKLEDEKFADSKVTAKFVKFISLVYMVAIQPKQKIKTITNNIINRQSVSNETNTESKKLGIRTSNLNNQVLNEIKNCG